MDSYLFGAGFMGHFQEVSEQRQSQPEALVFVHHRQLHQIYNQ